jgi:hypothetical protein
MDPLDRVAERQSVRNVFAEQVRQHHHRIERQQEWVAWARDQWLWPEQARAMDRLERCGTVWFQEWNGMRFPHTVRCGHPKCVRCQNPQDPHSPIHKRAARDAELILTPGTQRQDVFMITLDIGWDQNGADFKRASNAFRRRLENLLRRNLPGARCISYDQLSEAVGNPGLLHHHCHALINAPGWTREGLEELLRKIGRAHVQALYGDLRMSVENILRYAMGNLEPDMDRVEWLKHAGSVESIRGKSGRGMRWTFGIRTRKREDHRADTSVTTDTDEVISRYLSGFSSVEDLMEDTVSDQVVSDQVVSETEVPVYEAQAPRVIDADMGSRTSEYSDPLKYSPGASHQIWREHE